MQEQWHSKLGFILATVGAAVGLGSIWRFAYVVGENGGAAFLIVYMAMILLICIPLVIAELAIGRRGAADAVTAFEGATPDGKWRLLGGLGVVAAGAILTYYAVVAGWAARYFAHAFGTELWAVESSAHGAYFSSFIADGVSVVFWQGAMLAVTAAVVASGVNSGIERLNMWLMPLLGVIVVALALYAMTLPGSERGVAFLFAPDWSAFAKPAIYLNALGQAFFSIGIGMAVFVTYGSYLGAGTRIPAAAMIIVIIDTVFSVVAGLAVFPAVFAFGGDPAAGPGLAFVTFPQILQQMPAGRLIGPLFFFLLSAAALASMVSLLETCVAYAVHRRGAGRMRATAVLTAVIFALGLPSALGHGAVPWLTRSGKPILDLIDQGLSNFVLPVSGLLIALLVGWRMERRRALADADLWNNAVGRTWLWLIRLLAPVMIAFILVRSLGFI
jgi:NSS family neurotransmitter:Na+ symporter